MVAFLPRGSTLRSSAGARCGALRHVDHPYLRARGEGGEYEINRRRRRRAAARREEAPCPRVGSHGANLVHVLWAGRPCALVARWCRRPPALPSFDNYLSLAAALGLDYWLVPATLTLPPRQPAGRPGFPGAGSAAHDSRFSFAVDPHLLVRTLARALAMPPAESEAEGESEEESDDLCAALGSDVRVTDRIGVI